MQQAFTFLRFPPLLSPPSPPAFSRFAPSFPPFSPLSPLFPPPSPPSPPSFPPFYRIIIAKMGPWVWALKGSDALSAAAFEFTLKIARQGGYRSISVHRFPRRALTLYPQLCMGIQPGARFHARSADDLPANLYGHSTWRPLSRAER